MHVMLELDGEEFDLYLAREGDVVKVEVGGETFDVKLEGGTVTVGGRTLRVELRDSCVLLDGHEVPFRVADFQSGGAPGAHGVARKAAKVKPPMPGKIVAVHCREGEDVNAGQVLVVLEAMKMQNEIAAPGPGKVVKVHVKPGQTVEAKDILVELE
jgi:biotin carboxyl carrier protein